MSHLLCAVGRQSLELGPLTQQANGILATLKARSFRRSWKLDQSGREEGDWEYDISYLEEEPGVPYAPWVEIHFTGPFCHFPTMRPNNIEIGSFYSYNILTRNQQVDWFQNYRKELFTICQILEINEVIYLHDSSGVLGSILENQVWTNFPYEVIKQNMIKELGPPTPLSQVQFYTEPEDEEKDNRQWVLDDFQDLKDSILPDVQSGMAPEGE